jgi:hypothetical protein
MSVRVETKKAKSNYKNTFTSNADLEVDQGSSQLDIQ